MKPLWQETLSQLEQNLNPQHFTTWIKPIQFIGIDKDLVQIEVPNRFFLSWIRDNYADLIRETLSSVGAVSYRLKIEITSDSNDNSDKSLADSSLNRDIITDQTPRAALQKNAGSFNINKKYTFDEFVSGSSNQFAYAAANAVANNPATTYNPLFIYGGVGLGKTHLVNAIGNAILLKNPEMRVCYYTSEKFMN